MPGMNGIYVGNELKRVNENVIIFIVTSYSEYLDEAMRFRVFRYLSKPLEKQRFFRNFRDAIDLYHTMTVRIPIEIFALLAMVPIAFYSGRKRTRSKALQWGFYLFYPVHLTVLLLIRLFLQ